MWCKADKEADVVVVFRAKDSRFLTKLIYFASPHPIKIFCQIYYFIRIYDPIIFDFNILGSSLSFGYKTE